MVTLTSPKIPATPLMESEGLACFQSALEGADVFVEYGSGASTVYAINVLDVHTVISVDTDQRWLTEVGGQLDRPKDCNLIHCDLGEVGEWGRPATDKHFRRYFSYSQAPWLKAHKLGVTPDVVLIDGRFRVASFLASLMHSRPGTPILFDDYANRPAYHIVESFCPLVRLAGRMAVFTSHDRYHHGAIAANLARYSVIAD